MPTDPLFIASPGQLGAWLAANGATEKELWLGVWKVAAGRPSVTWPQIVDECLCHGWIDGVRKTIDETAWMIRLTPRKRGSRWSRINVARTEALIAEGRMTPAGMAAWEARDAEDDRRYAYEWEMAAFAPQDEARFRADEAAWRFWESCPPSYRRVLTWWVVNVKRPETGARRLDTLIAASAEGRRVQ